MAATGEPTSLPGDAKAILAADSGPSAAARPSMMDQVNAARATQQPAERDPISFLAGMTPPHPSSAPMDLSYNLTPSAATQTGDASSLSGAMSGPNPGESLPSDNGGTNMPLPGSFTPPRSPLQQAPPSGEGLSHSTSGAVAPPGASISAAQNVKAAGQGQPSHIAPPGMLGIRSKMAVS